MLEKNMSSMVSKTFDDFVFSLKLDVGLVKIISDCGDFNLMRKLAPDILEDGITRVKVHLYVMRNLLSIYPNDSLVHKLYDDILSELEDGLSDGYLSQFREYFSI